jgi:hypothetical protein
MKKYRIDENLVVNGELLPNGFDLIIEGTKARIEVPSDVPGDEELLYEEEIDLKETDTFQVHYDDNVPVCVEDGELIGEIQK